MAPRPNRTPSRSRAVVIATSLWHETTTREVGFLLLCAAAVQLVLAHRHDYPLHIIAGGSLALLVGTLVPRALVHRLGAVAVRCAFLLVVVVCAGLAEQVVYGPFDIVDVAFTLAGVLLALPGVEVLLGANDRSRSRLLALAALLVTLAVSQSGWASLR